MYFYLQLETDTKVQNDHYIDDGNKKPISEHKFCVNRFFNQCDIWTYGYDQKWLISDEVDKEIDNHFGYYGNIKV